MHIRENTWYLSLAGIVFQFIEMNYVSLCFLNPFICLWTSRLIQSLSYCEQCFIHMDVQVSPWYVALEFFRKLFRNPMCQMVEFCLWRTLHRDSINSEEGSSSFFISLHWKEVLSTQGLVMDTQNHHPWLQPFALNSILEAVRYW